MSELGICGWCGNAAVTYVITVPGRKNRRTTPVCEAHARDFEARGVLTVRREVDAKMERDRKRGQWLRTRHLR